MSDFDLPGLFRDVPPAQQLAILRAELITPVATVRGFAAVMKKRGQTETMPADFDKYIDKIVQAADKIQEFLDALGPNSDNR